MHVHNNCVEKNSFRINLYYNMFLSKEHLKYLWDLQHSSDII